MRTATTEKDVLADGADVLEAEPTLAVASVVKLPVRVVRELDGAIAVPLGERRRLGRGAVLRLVYVDRRLREVDDAARVIRIEMGHDDVPDVAPGEAEALDLTGRGLRFAELRLPHRHEHRAEPASGRTHVVEPHPRVDEDEAVVRRLDEQDVDDELGPAEDRPPAAGDEAAAERTHRAEIQVVDLHAPRAPCPLARLPFVSAASRPQKIGVSRRSIKEPP